MLDLQIAVAKTNKYASAESGDTVEMVERPLGGFSVVLADGQGSGRSAKNLSHLVTTKAIGMIKDGARDGTAARAVHDYLYAYRGGKVSATLVILTVDLAAQCIVTTRNSHCPILVAQAGKPLRLLAEQCEAIGIYAMTKPSVVQMPLEPKTILVTYSDGVLEAGSRTGNRIDVPALLLSYLDSKQKPSITELADYILEAALAADANRPADDMAVIVLGVEPAPPVQETRINPQVRRMTLRAPI